MGGSVDGSGVTCWGTGGGAQYHPGGIYRAGQAIVPGWQGNGRRGKGGKGGRKGTEEIVEEKKIGEKGKRGKERRGSSGMHKGWDRGPHTYVIHLNKPKTVTT